MSEMVGAPLVGAVFISLLIFLIGCATPEKTTPPAAGFVQEPIAVSPYENIPKRKDLRSLPEFFVIDDFNNPELKNHFGEPWKIEEPEPGELKAEFAAKQDALQGKRGNALFLTASLKANEKAVFKSWLKGLDVSQAQAVVLKCQINSQTSSFNGKLELVLKDVSGNEEISDLTSICLSADGWKDAVIPRSSLKKIDWNKIDEAAFLLSAGAEPLIAQIKIDEFAFYGKGDVEFLSKKDNLRGFPSKPYLSGRKAEVLAKEESHEFMAEIAKDTWKYFDNALDKTTQLPVDHILIGHSGGDIGAYTTPTNLAMYFLACVSAYELGFITKKEAVGRIQKTFNTLRQVKRWKGFHYNYYNTATLQVTRNYISSVDSGWLAAAWIVIRQAFPKELGPEATRFLKEINFNEFYDDGIGQIRLGFDGEKNDYSPYHYGLIATEARVMSFIGIGKGDLSREHWWFIYRTPPNQWTWQNQKPQGKEVEIERVTFFQGYYVHQGRKYVPSWGGSLFEFLMPTLVLKEKELALKSLGLNDRVATEIQIDYGLNRQGYPVWGLSPCTTSSGRQSRYAEYGVKYLGVKGYRDEGIITPHASILALDTLPEHVIDNLRRLLELYDIYGEYGLYDSVNVRTQQVNPEYIALDQGMILVAIANYVKNGVIKEYFHRDEIAQKAQSLLPLEEWFT